MPIMTWDDSLDVGVDAMNHEHRDILDAMNKIYDARAKGVTGAVIDNLVTRLGAITHHHFADEEAFMKRVGYPELDRHKALHSRLLEQFGAHAQQIKSAGGVPDDAFFHFLKFWLTSHIKGIDTKYGAHAKAHQA